MKVYTPFASIHDSFFTDEPYLWEWRVDGCSESLYFKTYSVGAAFYAIGSIWYQGRIQRESLE